jgi:hypothetical protein
LPYSDARVRQEPPGQIEHVSNTFHYQYIPIPARAGTKTWQFGYTDQN